MDWDRYKRECDSPAVLSRWMLMQTLELLQSVPGARCDIHSQVRHALAATLAGKPLTRPADHRGNTLTDMFPVALTSRQARTVLETVREAVAKGTTTSGTRERGLGGFVEAWSEYSESLSSRGQDDEGRTTLEEKRKEEK